MKKIQTVIVFTLFFTGCGKLAPVETPIQSESSLEIGTKPAEGIDGCPDDRKKLKTCSADSDCLLYEWVFGQPAVVNKAFKQCVGRPKELEQIIGGPAYGGDFSKVRVTCESSQCRLYDPWVWKQSHKR